MKKFNKNLFNLLKKEDLSEKNSISLIPSENIPSHLASSMYSHRAANRYLLPIDLHGKYCMPGRSTLEKLVLDLTQNLKSEYNSKKAFIKGLSGLQQMETIFLAFSEEIKDCIILDPNDGGHISTKSIAEKFKYKINYLKLNYSNWDIDYESLQKIIDEKRNTKILIYIDHTVVLKPFNIKKLLKVIPNNWIVYYDISHLQLFYATQTYSFPKSSNFFYGGSTHKSFPGPQKAVLFCEDGHIYEKISTAFSDTVSSYHMGSVLSLLITLEEMKTFGKSYSKQILKNSKRLALNLSKNFDVVGPKPDFTKTHQICIDVKDSIQATEDLSKISIITVPMRIPGRNKYGLRLGVQEITRLGMKEKEMDKLSEIITTCLTAKPTNQLNNKVRNMASGFTKINYCFKGDDTK